MTEIKANAFANFTAAVHCAVELRDKRDAALKAAAATLATLEAMVESCADQGDIKAAEVEYEAKVDVLVKLDTRTGLACDNIVSGCYTAVLANANPAVMARA
jgi:hypothetical protein